MLSGFATSAEIEKLRYFPDFLSLIVHLPNSSHSWAITCFNCSKISCGASLSVFLMTILKSYIVGKLSRESMRSPGVRSLSICGKLGLNSPLMARTATSNLVAPASFMTSPVFSSMSSPWSFNFKPVVVNWQSVEGSVHIVANTYFVVEDGSCLLHHPSICSALVTRVRLRKNV